MVRIGRWVEIALGLFFVASAASKAVDIEAFAVQISLYGVIKAPSLVTAAAYCTLTIETLLGAAFLAGWRLRGLTYAAAAVLTIVFSGLIAFAWRYKGLEDCGCFGDYIKMTPAQSLLKNLVLLIVLAVAWYGTRGISAAVASADATKKGRLRLAAALVGMALVVTCGLAGNRTDDSGTPRLIPIQVEDKDRPFQKFQFEIDGQRFNLGEGAYLVAMLNATCDHCRASVETLNDFFLMPELPELVALMLGSDEELEEFRLVTQPLFPIQPIKPLDFFEFIEKAPPRLIVVRDGRRTHAWEWEDEMPALETVLEAVASDASDALDAVDKKD